jgi:hypothetical protein
MQPCAKPTDYARSAFGSPLSGRVLRVVVFGVRLLEGLVREGVAVLEVVYGEFGFTGTGRAWLISREVVTSSAERPCPDPAQPKQAVELLTCMRLSNSPGRRRRRLPLLVTAAVAAATVTVVLVTTGTAAIGATGVPSFYAAITAQQIQVHATSNDAVTGAVSGPGRGWLLRQVSAAADDRTFFVAEAATGPSLCPADKFLEFTVTSAGRITDLHQVGVQVKGMVEGMAASPGGTRLAYSTICESMTSSVWSLHVMDLSSGTVSSWTNAASAAGAANVAYGGLQTLGWTDNGRSLSLSYQWLPSQANFSAVAVASLDPDSGSGTVQAHSRVVWHQNENCRTCVYEAWLSPAGTSLTAEALGVTVDLERLALPSGRVTDVLFRTKDKVTGAGIWTPPAWPDSSGTYWLVLANAETDLGWVSQGQFHPLQPVGSAEGVAW